MICMSSDNVVHPVTKTFTTLHYTSPNYTSLQFTTLYKIFVLTCLRVALVQAETCSTNVNEQFESQ